MKNFSQEFVVGIFVIVGIASFAWLAIKLGDLRLSDNSYPVNARFTSIAGLKDGATVEIAGVKVGRVSAIDLDNKDYEAVVHLAIDDAVKLASDSIASIRSSGIIGEKYINISPGGADDYIQRDGFIKETESSVSLEELISKYIFQKQDN